MKNKLEYILFLSLSFITKLFGLRLSRKFSKIIAGIFYYIIPIRKKTVISNLKKAFPELPSKKIRRIAYGSYKSFAIALIEILYLPYMEEEEAERNSNFLNLDLVEEKYQEKRGVILLSAHLGNWELNAASLGAQLNIPISIIVKPQRNPYVNKWLNDVRTRWNNKVVPLGSSIRQVYKELMDKNIVALIADQRGPADGIRVNFFGIKTAVYPGPAMLALKTNAPILYGIAVRQPDYTYKIVFKEISSENLPENNEDKIIELSQRHTSYLESVIRDNPEQWLWMHKRWKY
jgi:Kdo2-lipid IVA lauroyltransferase/acyltransferase